MNCDVVSIPSAYDLGRKVAGEACASIVEHFSDPVHYTATFAAAAASASDDAAKKHRSERASVPYFDPTLGAPMPDLPPVCRFWHERLLEACRRAAPSQGRDGGGSNEDAPSVAAAELLRCYECAIHPCVGRDNGEGKEKNPLGAKVEILKSYELLLSHLIRSHSCATSDVECTVDAKTERNNSIDGVDKCTKVGSDEHDAGREDLCNMIHVIANDICQWSIRLPTKNADSLWTVRNVILPCLMRLIEHCVILIAPRNDGGCIEKLLVRESLAVATVAAVPFVGDGKLKSGSFGLGSLLDWVFAIDDEDRVASRMSIAYTFHSYTLPDIPKAVESNVLPESILRSEFITRSVVDWSVPSAHISAPWTDGVTGIGSRIAMRLLKRVLSLFISGSDKEVEPTEKCTHLQTVLRRISQEVGGEIIATTARAHFFGRLRRSSDSTALKKPKPSGVFMPMVKRTGSANNEGSTVTGIVSSDEKPHIGLPMRLSAAAIIFSAAMARSGSSSIKACNDMFSDALPVAMSLLDDVQAIHQAVGAMILVSVVEAASSLGNDLVPTFVNRFGDIITSSLESSIQMLGRDEPTILATICLAQSKWVKYLELCSLNPGRTKSPSAVQMIARKAAADILVAISKQAQSGGHDRNDERVVGALVAGIHPLLAQLVGHPEAASIEIARMGLTVLLPIINWSGMRLEVRSAQVAALFCLVSLMHGAYPIMTHHGKKIMTEVFLLLDRAEKDADFLRNNEAGRSQSFDNEMVSTEAMITAALYTASTALALCGNSAGSILDHVQLTQSKTVLIDRCLEIRAMSDRFTNNSH